MPIFVDESHSYSFMCGVCLKTYSAGNRLSAWNMASRCEAQGEPDFSYSKGQKVRLPRELFGIRDAVVVGFVVRNEFPTARSRVGVHKPAYCVILEKTRGELFFLEEELKPVEE